jgi:hypothetical protein
MRILTGLLGGLALAGLLAAPAAAQDWCGFQQKAHARVQCGYSSLQQCKQALTDKAEKKSADKTVTCLPDPASGRRARPCRPRAGGDPYSAVTR